MSAAGRVVSRIARLHCTATPGPRLPSMHSHFAVFLGSQCLRLLRDFPPLSYSHHHPPLPPTLPPHTKQMSFGDLKPAAGMQQHLAEQEDEIISPIAFRKGVPRPDEAEDNEDVLEQLEQQAKALQIQGSNRPLSGAFAATTTTTIGTATTNLLKMDRQQEVKAQAAEALAKNYALKLDVVKQIEDFEIARREYYDHKRESNAMYWMAFTLVMKRSKSENTRYLDFFSRKVAAENTYVRCILEMKEESEKLKHGGGHKSTLETAFGAAKKNMLDDLLGVQEQMVEQVHAFGKVIEGEIVPQMEGMITTFNMAVELILVDGETYLEDIELAEGNVQQAYKEYRDQAEALEKMGMNENGLDLWVFEMQYRVAVGVLLETWGVCSSGLGGLFTRMKDTEMTRRQAIHTALGTLHDQQTAYWKKLPELGFTFSSLVHSRVADPGLIEKEIGADIRTGAQRLQQSEEGKRRKRQIMANRPVRMFTPTPAAMAAMGGMSTNGLSNTLDAALPLAITMNAAAVGTAAAGGGVGAEVRGSSSKKRVAKEFGHVLQGPLGSPLTKRVQVGGPRFRPSLPPFLPVFPIPPSLFSSITLLRLGPQDTSSFIYTIVSPSQSLSLPPSLPFLGVRAEDH